MAWFNVQSKLQSRLVSIIRHWQSLLIRALPFLHQEREWAVETNSWSKTLSSTAKYELPIIQTLNSVTWRNLELFSVMHPLRCSLRTKVLQKAQLWCLPVCQELVNTNATTRVGKRGKRRGDSHCNSNCFMWDTTKTTVLEFAGARPWDQWHKSRTLRTTEEKCCCRGSGIHCPSSLCGRVRSCEWKADYRIADGRSSRPARVLPKLHFSRALSFPAPAWIEPE